MIGNNTNVQIAQNQFKTVGKIISVNKVNKTVDNTKVLYSILIEPTLGETKSFAVTKNTQFFISKENSRELVSISDLKQEQEIEVWLHFASDHLVEANEITIFQ